MKTFSIIVILAVIALGIGFMMTKNNKGLINNNETLTNATSTDTYATSTDSDVNGTSTATTTQTTTNTTDNMSKSTAVFKTNKGTIEIELFTEDTPKTTENFIKLANSGYYNGTKFHRVIDGFMIQGGDPLTKDDSKQAQWGTGGPGYTFADEFVSSLSNVPGTISMANAGPGTNGSQFFINVAPNTFLDGKHSVFGKVVAGMDVVTAISKVETVPGDRPLSAVIIESVEIK